MDPHFKTRFQETLARQATMRTLGIEIALLEAGEITLTRMFPPTPSSMTLFTPES
jgi:hypothetical protein